MARLPALTSRCFAFVLAPLLLTAACGSPEIAQRPDTAVIWSAAPHLPEPVTNNAVAAVATPAGVSVFSFLGMDSTKTWSGVTNVTYRWDLQDDAGWRAAAAVPGPGRLAATAQVVKGRVYVLGGYTVAADGTERTLPNVDIYDPATDSWTRGANIPTPVDDAVSGVWRDSLIVLVSGWHDDGNVADVQWYDPAANRWTSGTPIPGTPVFGHAGTLADDRIVYLDGARVVDGDPRYALTEEDWMGVVDPAAPERVSWAPLPPHPEPALYRAAAGTLGGLALFVGGTENPYNYDGIGYDGRPAEPVRQVLAYAPRANRWQNIAAPPIATMDHRTLGIAGGKVFLVGGMEEGQVVTDKVWVADVQALLATIW